MAANVTLQADTAAAFAERYADHPDPLVIAVVMAVQAASTPTEGSPLDLLRELWGYEGDDVAEGILVVAKYCRMLERRMNDAETIQDRRDLG